VPQEQIDRRKKLDAVRFYHTFNHHPTNAAPVATTTEPPAIQKISVSAWRGTEKSVSVNNAKYIAVLMNNAVVPQSTAPMEDKSRILFMVRQTPGGAVVTK
jgi:hypothetical protein